MDFGDYPSADAGGAGIGVFQPFHVAFSRCTGIAGPGDEVMKYWQGLGYYSRARNLHAAAKEIVENSAGSFRNYSDVLYPERDRGIYGGGYLLVCLEIALCCRGWECLPGIGPDLRYRYPIDSNAGKKVFSGLVAELLDRRHPDLYNQAIMDFGAIQCTRKSPFVYIVRYGKNCMALASGQVENYR